MRAWPLKLGNLRPPAAVHYRLLLYRGFHNRLVQIVFEDRVERPENGSGRLPPRYVRLDKGDLYRDFDLRSAF
jgi:hypothetical protein